MRDIVAMSSAEINAADIQAVIAVVRSGRLGLGPQAVEAAALYTEGACTACDLGFVKI